MIARVHPRGSRLAGLLWYLYGPGRKAEHVNPRLVGGWRHPAELEPPLRDDGQRDFRLLTGLMEIPLAMLGDRAPAEHVWHCSIRAAPGDPVLGDGAWMRIAERVMDRTGLSRAGHEDEGVPWVAVHHGDQHIHIVAVLARQDGRRAEPRNDYYRIAEALADAEAEYGLLPTARPDRTADKRPTRPEVEKARAAGRDEPARATLAREVHSAAAAARSEPEFWAGLEQRGVLARTSPPRQAGPQPGAIPGPPAGYSVALPGDLARDGRPVWFAGGQLAADLTLPKLRRRWPGPDDPGPGPEAGQATGPPPPGADPGPPRASGASSSAAGPDPGASRLTGNGMTDGAARAALRSEVARAAAAARAEPEFWAGLARAGIMARQRPSRDRPGEADGYAVSLPGLVHHRDGHQVWYGGGTLDQRLTLGALRARWQAGLPGAAPGPDSLSDADAREAYAYAAVIADAAARQMRSARGNDAADIAWAAADLVASAAHVTGSPELRRAAAGFRRAGRAAWGRIPGPTPGGLSLRTAAWLLGRCRHRRVRPAVRMALVTALARLGRALAAMRAQQQRLLQALAAREAAAGLAAVQAPAWPGPPTGRPAAPGQRPGSSARRRPGGPAAAPAPRAGPRSGPRV